MCESSPTHVPLTMQQIINVQTGGSGSFSHENEAGPREDRPLETSGSGRKVLQDVWFIICIFVLLSVKTVQKQNI